uniref:Uncharacterized protein n=1 Tax=Lotharella globosa TaxID=91324 RepID=A0A7S3YVB3_9EUKA|mmetsp:Transcript_23141/g.45151  ORF Transcript_23141/g.45151 Transcript_23141/m.45151 type:complete len:220 (+) Transcript_23141:37-696(+)
MQPWRQEPLQLLYETMIFLLRHVDTSEQFVQALAQEWCDHQAVKLPKVQAKCRVVSGNIENITSSPPPLNAMARRARVNSGLFQSDLWQRPDLLAIIESAIRGNAKCASLEPELIQMPQKKNKSSALTPPQTPPSPRKHERIIVTADSVASAARRLRALVMQSDLIVRGPSQPPSEITLEDLAAQFREVFRSLTNATIDSSFVDFLASPSPGHQAQDAT